MKGNDGLIGLFDTHRVDELPRGKGFTAESRVVEWGEERVGAFEGSFVWVGGFIVRGSGMGTKNKQLGHGACENWFLWIQQGTLCAYSELRKIGI